VDLRKSTGAFRKSKRAILKSSPAFYFCLLSFLILENNYFDPKTAAK